MTDTVILAVSNPMVVWYAVVAALLMACLIYSFRLAHHHNHHRHMRPHHVHAVDMGKERDMFYIPGDQRYDDRDADFDEL